MQKYCQEEMFKKTEDASLNRMLNYGRDPFAALAKPLSSNEYFLFYHCTSLPPLRNGLTRRLLTRLNMFVLSCQKPRSNAAYLSIYPSMKLRSCVIGSVLLSRTGISSAPAFF
jgi:hypothetical protein